MASDSAMGATLTFGTSGFNAPITSIALTGLTRPSVDTTHLGTTTARTFQPGDLYDPGQLEVEYQHEHDHSDLSMIPPIGGASETITLAVAGGDTISASGFLTGADLYDGTNEDDEVVTGTMTIKFTGAITHSST